MNQVDVIEYITKALVDKTDDVRIDEIRNEQSSVLELRVDPDDLGKIIGRKGRIAKNLRTLLNATKTEDSRRFTLEIID